MNKATYWAGSINISEETDRQTRGDILKEIAPTSSGDDRDYNDNTTSNGQQQCRGESNYDWDAHELEVQSVFHNMTMHSDHHDWSVMDLYTYALNLDNVNDVYKMRTKKIDTRCYPKSLDPFDEIVFFIRNKGPQLWARSGDLMFVFEWLYKNNSLKLMRHPVTGDTIFHKNPRLVDELRLNQEILVLVNYRDQTVALRKWFQENEMPAIEIK